MKCSGSNWKTDSEIGSVLNSHYVDVAVVSTLFDFNDYESPTHNYLQDVNYISLISGMCQILQYLVKINELI